MPKERLAAFSDGVIAILITIMVLELRVPHGDNWADLVTVLPVFLAYVLSFIYVGIYWNNHHHMIHTLHHVDGLILWANMHLLFWLSLIPFATAWISETRFSHAPTALYGLSLLMPAIAYYLLQRAIIRRQGADGPLAHALGRDLKGRISPLIYLTGIACAFALPWVSYTLFIGAALMWLVPDRRIERDVRE
jgi:uncharacterized membrane protein